VDAALKELSQPFAKLYAREGRPSIPPERLLRAQNLSRNTPGILSGNPEKVGSRPRGKSMNDFKGYKPGSLH